MQWIDHVELLRHLENDKAYRIDDWLVCMSLNEAEEAVDVSKTLDKYDVAWNFKTKVVQEIFQVIVMLHLYDLQLNRNKNKALSMKQRITMFRQN